MEALFVGLRKPNDWTDENVQYLSVVNDASEDEIQKTLEDLIAEKGFAIVLVVTSFREYHRAVGRPSKRGPRG